MCVESELDIPTSDEDIHYTTDPLTVPNIHDVLIHVTKYYVVGGNEKMLASAPLAPGSVRRGVPQLVARPLCRAICGSAGCARHSVAGA